MTRKTNKPARANTFKATSPLAKLVKLADAIAQSNADIQSVLDEANERVNALKSPVLAAFQAVGAALAEEHAEGLTQTIFDEAYKPGLMAHLVTRQTEGGADEKTAKLRAGVQFNHMRAALLGFAEGIALPEGCNSFQDYAKHVKADAPDLFDAKPEGAKRGRKAGRKVKDAKPSIDVAELSGKRGKDKDVAAEIIDLIRIAKDRGMLVQVRDALADLLDE